MKHKQEETAVCHEANISVLQHTFTAVFENLRSNIAMLRYLPRAGKCIMFVYICKAVPEQMNYGEKGQLPTMQAGY